MTGDIHHAEYQDLLGAYALDAIGHSDAQRTTSHLSDCVKCRIEVDALREVAGALGTSVQPVPHELWDRIAERLGRETCQAERMLGPPSKPPAVLGRFGPTGRRHPHDVIGEHTVSRRVEGPRSRYLRWALSVAAAVAVATLTVSLWRARDHVDRLNADMASRGDHAAIAAALVTPGHRVVDLRNGEGTLLAELVLLSGGRGYLVSSSLPVLSGDKTYQLWGVIDDQPISLGLLGAHPRQAGFTVASPTLTRLTVTVEPPGGVPTPDRSAIAFGSITA
jgi:Anti-sigma-K factor rskA